MVGQLDIYVQKKGVGPLPHNIYKNQLKMNQRTKCKSYNYKMIGRKHKVVMYNKVIFMTLDLAMDF